jgi:hypothetical protein
MEKGTPEILMYRYFQLTKKQYNALDEESKEGAVFAFDHPTMGSTKKVLMTTPRSPEVGTEKNKAEARDLIDAWGVIYAGVFGL